MGLSDFAQMPYTLFGATLDVVAFVWIAEDHIGLLNQFELPFWLAALIVSILFDAWLYVWHRLNHVLPFFWRSIKSISVTWEWTFQLRCDFIQEKFFFRRS